MTDTRTLYTYYRRRRKAINHALDAAALAFVFGSLYLAWLVLA
jgi:hypothetical protein